MIVFEIELAGYNGVSEKMPVPDNSIMCAYPIIRVLVACAVVSEKTDGALGGREHDLCFGCYFNLCTAGFLR
jgi:hypothetical protein